MKLTTPYADLLPPLTTEEFEALRASIEQDGVRVPIQVDENGAILDGHHRYKIAPDAPYQVIPGLSNAEKKAYVVLTNSARRNMSPEQKTESRETKIKIAIELKQEGKTQERIAVALGVTHKTISVWLNEEENTTNVPGYNGCNFDVRVVVPKAAYETIFQRTEEGETQAQIAADFGVSQQSIQKILGKVRQERERPNEPPPLPAHQYHVIYADPPWRYDNSGFDQSAAEHYPTMSNDDIFAMPVKEMAGDPCVLYLWSTAPFLPVALSVIEAWGFVYKTHRIWIKDRAPSIGWWLQTKHELLLIATHGDNYHPSERLESVVYAPVERHSKKPEIFARDIERVHQGKKIELFARQTRPGWEAWGNEIVTT